MNLLPALALATLISDDACSARLDGLLSVHREYGLPVPSPGASLVRIASDSGQACLLIRLLSEEEVALFNKWGTPAVVKPDPFALGSEVEYGDLTFAIKCHERGWRTLAVPRSVSGSPRRATSRAGTRVRGVVALDVPKIFLHDAGLPVVAKILETRLPRLSGFCE